MTDNIAYFLLIFSIVPTGAVFLYYIADREAYYRKYATPLKLSLSFGVVGFVGWVGVSLGFGELGLGWRGGSRGRGLFGFGIAAALGASWLVVSVSNLRTYIRFRMGTTREPTEPGETVIITGVVAPDGPPRSSPISGERAVAWEWRTKDHLEFSLRGKTASGSDGTAFELVTDTKRYQVRDSWRVLDGAETSSFSASPDALDVNDSTVLPDRDGVRVREVQEALVRPGDNVTVLGRLEGESDTATIDPIAILYGGSTDAGRGYLSRGLKYGAMGLLVFAVITSLTIHIYDISVAW